jgi:hypothetical protein
LIGLQPWTGWGWGELSYAHFSTLYPGVRFCEILDNAHNLPLHLAVELGLPVALLVCSAVAYAVVRLRPWCETQPARQMAWGVLMALALHSMVEYPLWYGPFQVAALLCVLLLWKVSPGSSAAPPAAQGAASLVMVVAILLIASSLMVARAYWRMSQLYLPPDARAAAYREDTLAKVRGTWLFQNQVMFAELTTSVPTLDNAAHIHALAQQMLHFSPEPKVVELLLDSAALLGHSEEVQYLRPRFEAAFAERYAEWVKRAAADTKP